MDARVLCRKLVALAAVFTLTMSPIMAMAGEVIDGQTPANGQPQAGDVGAGWDGSTHRVFRMDPSGILRTTEEYPQSSQFATTTVASLQQVFWCRYTSLQPLGTAYTAYPYGQKIISFTTRRQPLATPSSALIYVFTSEDGADWKPVMISKSGATAGHWADYGDSTTQDQLKCHLPLRGSAASSGLWKFSYTIPSNIYLGRYNLLFATKSDTTSGQVDSVLVSAAWAGREY